MIKEQVRKLREISEIITELENRPENIKLDITAIKNGAQLESFEIGGVNAEDDNLIVYDGLNANDNN